MVMSVLSIEETSTVVDMYSEVFTVQNTPQKKWEVMYLCTPTRGIFIFAAGLEGEKARHTVCVCIL